MLLTSRCAHDGQLCLPFRGRHTIFHFYFNIVELVRLQFGSNMLLHNSIGDVACIHVNVTEVPRTCSTERALLTATLPSSRSFTVALSRLRKNWFVAWFSFYFSSFTVFNLLIFGVLSVSESHSRLFRAHIGADLHRRNCGRQV